MVWSQVLDCNLYQWAEQNTMYLYELVNQKIKILNVLKKMGIEHGHSHNENFCLRFVRNADGSIDYTQVPRLYLIDWDAATYNPSNDQTQNQTDTPSDQK